VCIYILLLHGAGSHFFYSSPEWTNAILALGIGPFMFSATVVLLHHVRGGAYESCFVAHGAKKSLPIEILIRLAMYLFFRNLPHPWGLKQAHKALPLTPPPQASFSGSFT